MQFSTLNYLQQVKLTTDSVYQAEEVINDNDETIYAMGEAQAL